VFDQVQQEKEDEAVDKLLAASKPDLRVYETNGRVRQGLTAMRVADYFRIADPTVRNLEERADRSLNERIALIAPTIPPALVSSSVTLTGR
jgi:hypothetical protein